MFPLKRPKSKYIPIQAQLKELGQQELRRTNQLISKKEEIAKAKELFSNKETMEEAIQLLKDSGISPKFAAEMITQWHLEEVSKASE